MQKYLIFKHIAMQKMFLFPSYTGKEVEQRCGVCGPFQTYETNATKVNLKIYKKILCENSWRLCPKKVTPVCNLLKSPKK